MKARAQRKGHEKEAKPWHEGATRDEVLKAVINKELWNVGVATSLTHKLMQTLGMRPSDETWQELHERNVRNWGNGDTIVAFTLEWDDGTTEDLDINLGVTALIAEGIHTELGLRL